MMGQTTSADVYPLIHQEAQRAAQCREQGNMACYQEHKARMEALQRIYQGFGTQEDMLEIEKARSWAGIGNIFGGISTTGILILGAAMLMMFGRK